MIHYINEALNQHPAVVQRLS